MTLWLLLAALTALVLALLLAPLLRRRQTAADRAAFDIEVYLDQLRELERDIERGAIAGAAADRQRQEAAAPDAAAPRARRHPLLAIALVVALPVAAGLLYLDLGSPDLPGQPFADRPAAPEGDLMARAAARIAEAESAVRDNPDNPRAWFDLGRIRALAQRWPAAAEAFGEAARRDPAQPVYLAAWAEALIFAADGTVTPRARELLAAALAGDPADPRTRYYVALGEQQAGERAAALDRTAARPSADDMAAAQQMAPEERQAMIRSMVEGLAARLETEPDDVEGWRQLARSWGVLGETEKASAAWGRALALAPDHAETLFNGAIAAMEAGDRTTALDRFRSLKAQIPAEHDAYGAVERAIQQLEAGEKP
jgi:cytochrome c-type biogenesis protein CcmH